MTDDICGYEGTTTGEPCRHPAGSCPVPSHSNENEANPQGRETAFTEDRARDAIEAAREGKSKAGCGRAAGVDKATLERWADAGYTVDGEDFRTAFTRARSAGETRLIHGGMYDPDADSSMARFLLSTSFDYIKTEKREHEHAGEDGGPIMIVEEDGDSSE